MQFRVYVIRREGVPQMRHRWMESSVVGRLVMADEFHAGFHRQTLTARLVDERGNPVPGIEPLHDAVLMSVKPGHWTMRGIERFEKWPEQWLDFAQTWVLMPVDEV